MSLLLGVLKWVALVALAIFIIGPLLVTTVWAFAGEWTGTEPVPSGMVVQMVAGGLQRVGDHGCDQSSVWRRPRVVMLLSAVICLPASYAFARFRFTGRQPLLLAFLAANAFPKFGLYVTILTMFYNIGFNDSVQGIVTIQLIETLVFMIWIPATAFQNIDRSLEEAALDAGCSRVGVFWRITLPLAAPAIAVAMLLAFVSAIDESQGTLIVGLPDNVTMPLIMYNAVNSYAEPEGAVFALILSIPSLLLLGVAQYPQRVDAASTYWERGKGMAELTLRKIVKWYGAVQAVKEISLEVASGELLCILSPSGCGKSTTLRMIGGFEIPDGGEILLDGRPIGYLPPNKRPTAMVFQKYTLWPHMRVWDNVAFGLKLRKLPRAQIARKVGEALEMVSLPEAARRYPNQLSGGEQQRIALARALVLEPRVLLLDEPLSNLDARLRIRMREEIKRIQRRVGITSIFVTHDQEEALSIYDRIAVMSKGVQSNWIRRAPSYAQPRAPCSSLISLVP